MENLSCVKMKKELPEALIISIIILFLVCVSFLVPPFIGYILSIVAVGLIIILFIALIDFLIKRRK